MNKVIPTGTGLLIFFCLLWTAWADMESPDWQRLREDFSSVRSIQAYFVQEKNLKLINQPLISKGSFTYRAPGDMRWEYELPAKSLLIFHNDQVRRYVWQKDRYQAQDGGQNQAMGMVLGEIRIWLAGDFDRSALFIARLVKGDSNQIILTPKNLSLKGYILQVILTLGVKPGILDSIEIDEGSGTTTCIRFNNVDVNLLIDESLFQHPPQASRQMTQE